MLQFVLVERRAVRPGAADVEDERAGVGFALSLKPHQRVEVSCERRQAGVLQGYGDERAGLGEGDVDATVVDQPDVLHAEPLSRAGHATSRDI